VQHHPVADRIERRIGDDGELVVGRHLVPSRRGHAVVRDAVGVEASRERAIG
jgi:hypothetical protein